MASWRWQSYYQKLHPLFVELDRRLLQPPRSTVQPVPPGKRRTGAAAATRGMYSRRSTTRRGGQAFLLVCHQRLLPGNFPGHGLLLQTKNQYDMKKLHKSQKLLVNQQKKSAIMLGLCSRSKGDRHSWRDAPPCTTAYTTPEDAEPAKIYAQSRVKPVIKNGFFVKNHGFFTCHACFSETRS